MQPHDFTGASPSDQGGADSFETLGFVDIGTNSIRLVVVRVDPDRTWTTITSQKETVRLGEGEFAGATRIQPQAMARAIHVSRTFVELARAHGATEMIAVATAATREAENGAQFVRRLRDEAGLVVNVVSGTEEARLIFLGVLTKVNLGERRALVIDIGGGSTEIAYGGVSGAEFVDSLRIGAIRLTSEFPDAAGAISSERYAEMTHRVRVAAARTRRKLGDGRLDVAFGTSGTIRNAAAMAARLDGGNGPSDGLRYAHVRRLAGLLRSLRLEERRAVPGLSSDRADIILAGVAILDAVMGELALDELRPLADCGLREGLILDHLERQAGRSCCGTGVRERSVLQLARATTFDEPHAQHVADLSLDLFDSAREAGVHRLGSEMRELLRYAALLHDIGTFVNYADHSAHSAYIIRNADLLGFDQREISLIAAVAQFHRKARPTPRHAALADLGAAERKAVRPLSAMLRLAEYLDRGHSAAIAHAALRRDGKRTLALEVHAQREWDLELWRLQANLASVEALLGRRLTISAVDTKKSRTRQQDSAPGGSD